jgi:glycosyltransferase involved in cell wall biosynthesis
MTHKLKTAILHYTSPPVIGGVEGVIHAHALQFASHGYPLTIISGRGNADALPYGVEYRRIPEMDSLHPEIANATEILNSGNVPENFDQITQQLEDQIRPVLSGFDHVIVHNIFTKHFNLPLTAALFRLMDAGDIRSALAWCHDLSWSSPNSRGKVFPAYPWNLLKSDHLRMSFVTISLQRKQEILSTYNINPGRVQIIYNGVDPAQVLGLSSEGANLIERMGLLKADLIMLMPVRVTQAKNIEYALQVTSELKKLGCRPKVIISGPPDPHDSASQIYFNSLIKLRSELDVEEEMQFVYQNGKDPEKGYFINLDVVYDLLRVADIMFMPSHREGFGMPVLEAGLAGIPVFSTPVPAAAELASGEAYIFSPQTNAVEVAGQIHQWMKENSEYRLRMKVRRQYTWKAIFEQDLLPILEANHPDG